jgi:hypothetical protein
MNYCQATWTHYSGMAICDCTSKAERGKRYCKEHRDWNRREPRFSIEDVERALIEARSRSSRLGGFVVERYFRTTLGLPCPEEET